MVTLRVRPRAVADKEEERVKNLMQSCTYGTFSYVTRGLFERHRLIFSTQLAIKTKRSFKLVFLA